MAKAGHTMCLMIYTLKPKVAIDNENLCIPLSAVFPLGYSCKARTKKQKAKVLLKLSDCTYT